MKWLNDLEKYLKANNIRISFDPNSLDHGLSVWQSTKKGNSGSFGGYEIGMPAPTRPYFFFSKHSDNITECEDVEDVHDLESTEGYHQANGISNIRGLDGLSVGDIVTVASGYEMIEVDDYSEDAEGGAKRKAASIADIVGTLIYIGDNQFIDVKGLNETVFGAIQVMATLFATGGNSKHLGMKTGQVTDFVKGTMASWDEAEKLSWACDDD